MFYQQEGCNAASLREGIQVDGAIGAEFTVPVLQGGCCLAHPRMPAMVTIDTHKISNFKEYLQVNSSATSSRGDTPGTHA